MVCLVVKEEMSWVQILAPEYKVECKQCEEYVQELDLELPFVFFSFLLIVLFYWEVLFPLEPEYLDQKADMLLTVPSFLDKGQDHLMVFTKDNLIGDKNPLVVKKNNN